MTTPSAALCYAISLLLFAPCAAIMLAPSPSPEHRHAQQTSLVASSGGHGGPKYAVILTWIQDPTDPATTPEKIAAMSCPLVLALHNVANASRAALPAATRATTTIDEVLYTDMKYFGPGARDFMESRGVRVVDLGNDPLSTAVDVGDIIKMNPLIADNISEYATYVVGNRIKLAFLWATEYDAILAIDWDVLWVGPQAGSVDLLGQVANGQESILGFHSPYSPIAGGIVAVRPSDEFRQLFIRALEHGFSFQDGFGATGPGLALVDHYHHLYCSTDMGLIDPCCLGKGNTWCIPGGDNDQGFLIHLALVGAPHLYKEWGDGNWTHLGFFQSNGSPKPWQTHQLTDLLAVAQGNWDFDFIEQWSDFWTYWKNGQSRLLEHDDQCTAFFEDRLHTLRAIVGRDWETYSGLVGV